MEHPAGQSPKAKQITFSVYPIHEQLVIELAIKRRNLNKSQILQDAVIELARQELDDKRFQEITEGAA
jgi:hypothetical protein